MRQGGGALLEAVWGPGQEKSVHEGVPVCEPLCTLMYACVHAHTHAHTHSCTHTHTIMYTHALTHMLMCVHAHTHMHTLTVMHTLIFTYAHVLIFMHTKTLVHSQMQKLLDQNYCSGWLQATLEGSHPGAQCLLWPVSLKAFSQALGRETQLSLRREAGSQDDSIATSHGSMVGAGSQD